jgi:class 3 adenylate cyclase
MVDSLSATLAAEIYKVFLAAAARVIRSEEGAITAYDGDRVMAVFLGSSQCSTAARCALKINWAVKNILTPSLRSHYPQSAPKHEIKHRVGIDKSKRLVARTGVRGGNDLVWVGRAANYAAKLAAVPDEGHASFITKRVFDSLDERSKFGGNPKRLMWEERSLGGLGETTVYRSNWWWSLA